MSLLFVHSNISASVVHLYITSILFYELSHQKMIASCWRHRSSCKRPAINMAIIRPQNITHCMLLQNLNGYAIISQLNIVTYREASLALFVHF